MKNSSVEILHQPVSRTEGTIIQQQCEAARGGGFGVQKAAGSQNSKQHQTWEILQGKLFGFWRTLGRNAVRTCLFSLSACDLICEHGGDVLSHLSCQGSLLQDPSASLPGLDNISSAQQCLISHGCQTHSS